MAAPWVVVLGLLDPAPEGAMVDTVGAGVVDELEGVPVVPEGLVVVVAGRELVVVEGVVVDDVVGVAVVVVRAGGRPVVGVGVRT